MDLGTVPDWITAVSTVAATAAATAAGVIAWRTHRRDVTLGRQADAAGFHAWLAEDMRESSHRVRLILMNLGRAPLYEISVQCILDRRHVELPNAGKEWQVLPPGVYVVGPHEKFGWRLPEPAADLRHYRPFTRSTSYGVRRMEFVDGAGNRWGRDGAGALTPATDTRRGA